MSARHASSDERKLTRRSFFRRAARSVLSGVILIGVLAAFTRFRSGKRAPAGARVALGMVRPPGSLDERDFLSACIRCTRCADACSTNAIRFFGPEAGPLHATPHIDPIDRACNMCLACGDACPTGALEPLSAMEDVQMGLAVIDDRLCVSINGTGVCGACFTVCPLRGKAITQGIRNAPTVHPEFCTGCGLCEQHCIVDERPGIRAIQVTTERSWPMLAGAV